MHVKVPRLPLLTAGLFLLTFMTRAARAEVHPLPGLRQVVEQAASRAPEVVRTNRTLAEGRAGYVGAGLPPIGNPYFEVITERDIANSSHRQFAVGVSAWLPFEVSGQRRARLASIDALVAWQGAAVRSARSLAMGRAVAAYGRLSTAQGRIEVLEQIVHAASDEVEIYAQRLQAGDTVARDAQLVRVEWGRSRLLLEEARATLPAITAELALLTGEDYVATSAAPLEPPIPSAAAALRSAPNAAPVLAARAEADFHSAEAERWRKEGKSPFTLMLQGARGDQGELRVAAGVAYSLPVRRNQGERARSEAARLTAQTEARLRQTAIQRAAQAAVAEIHGLREARRQLDEVTLPDARAAVKSSEELYQAGKEDWLSVIISRRELAVLTLRKFDLAERQWLLLGRLVEVTGELP